MYILSKARELYNDQGILELKHFQNYYSFLGTTVHFLDDQIIFVINLPILTTENYSYYHLIPVPIQNLTIFPNTPYLGMSTNEYVTTPHSCPKIEDTYICNFPSQPRDDSCLIQLLSEANHNNCPVHHVSVTKPILTMLEENHILAVPVTILQIPDCQNGIQTISQPVVIHLPAGCSTTIANQRFTATKNEVPLQMFILPKIEIPQLWNLTVNKNEPLLLEKVDLTHVNSLKDLAQNVKSLQFKPDPANLLESTNSWLFTTIIIILCLIVIFIIYRKCCHRCPSLIPCCSTKTTTRILPTFSKRYKENLSSPGDDQPTSAGGVILVSR